MPYALPSRHRLAHDYSTLLHDLIVGGLRSAIEHGAFQIPVHLAPEESSTIDELEGEELYAWLEANRGPNTTATLDYLLLIQAILTDFCHFVLEGLRASAKGKLTVAYALLRKPFRDNLFYLEWLLADPKDFLVRFRDHSPHGIEFGTLDIARRKAIVTAACNHCDPPGAEPSLLYDLRFEKSFDRGLAVPWDQAIHLVTSRKLVATDRQNLNFVFSGSEEVETQWAHLYWMLPYLLYYSSFVVDALFDTFLTVDAAYRDMKWLRRAVGYELWAAYTRGDRSNQRHPSLKLLVAGFRPECSFCGASLPKHGRNLKAFTIHGTMRCSKCRSKIILDLTDAPPLKTR